MAEIKGVKNKYKNGKCWVTDKLELTKEKGKGLYFDSVSEAEYYIYLVKRELFFTRQNKYTLMNGYSYMGRLVRSIIYKDDFRVGNYIIDIKGMETPDYKLKAKLMKLWCIQNSTDDDRLYYLALYDLNKKGYFLRNMPYGIRYVDVQIMHEWEREIAKVPKGKGVNARKEARAIELIEEYRKLSNTICNVTLNAMYYF